MWPFNHKGTLEPKPVLPPPKKCDHKWADIRVGDDECWYIDYNANDCSLEYTIYEPYVCIHCKKRKDVILEGPRCISFSGNEGVWEELNSIRKKYPQIKDRAVVEDAINDLQLVDRSYIDAARYVLNLKL